MKYFGVMTDLSGKPLSLKLGIKEDSTLALLHAPTSFRLNVPPGVMVKRVARGHVDVVLGFYLRVSRLEREIETLGLMAFPAGGLWIAWPKRASDVATDVTDNAIREIALPLGLVDNKVCAMDETWTALRLAWRRTRRSSRD
ncbi:MAG TPA: DUF3052 domain-containing protein [Acidimicrobiales bacterium]